MEGIPNLPSDMFFNDGIFLCERTDPVFEARLSGARSLARPQHSRSFSWVRSAEKRESSLRALLLPRERASERVAVASAGTAVDLQDLQLQGPTESAIATENNTHCEDTQNEIPKMNKLAEADERRAILLGFIYSFGG